MSPEPARRGHAGIWISVLCLAAFGAGLTELFRARLETGDVYPPYSTLRSDPLGCRALFGALERYPDVEVRRAIARADFRAQPAGTVYLFLGLDAGTFSAMGTGMRDMDTLTRQGYRVAISFAPDVWNENSETGHRKADTVRADSGKEEKAPARIWRPPRKGGTDAALPKPEWGFRLRLDSAFAEGAHGTAISTGNLSDTLPWLSGLYFDSLQDGWTVLYRRGAKPVVIERKQGTGSLVLASDSYFASNEAQRGAHPARLASLLIGAGTRVFFDERHLGVRQDDAIVDLLKRHRLHWIIPSLLLLFGLFVWQGRARLSPPDRSGTVMAAGADPRAAMAGLLRRNLGERGMLAAGYALWKEGAGRRAAPTPEEDIAVQAILNRAPAGPARPYPLASAYAQIHAILNRRKRK